jgi:hypothetical protein
LQRNTSELVAKLENGATSWPKAVVRSANALKDCAFCDIPSLLFQYSHGPIRWNRLFAIAMLHCKITACKRYLAAALGTLMNEAERQQTPDFWH